MVEIDLLSTMGRSMLKNKNNKKKMSLTMEKTNGNNYTY